MKVNMLRLISIAGLGLCSTAINAAHVAPVFSGSWFTGVVYVSMDACANTNFNYVNKMQGDAASIAQQLLIDVPPRTDCEWSKPYLSREMQNGTSDFVGNDKDWKLILSDKSMPHVSVWGRDCKDKQGRILQGKSVTIQPAYICPAGSQRSFNTDSSEGEIGCTTTPASCKADVMGRDLNLSGFGDLGHIGLAIPGFTSGMVFEVLKTPNEGIYTNSMQSFKNFPNSPYWGDKIGLPGTPILSMDDATKIIGAGIAQGSYPFEYTLTWDWHPGSMSSQYVLNQQNHGFEKVLAGKSAKFRCDSFVYYTYLAGANLHIVPDFGIPDVPKTLFNSLSTCRDHEGKYCGAFKEMNLARSFLAKSSLATVFNQPNVDIHLVDNTMKDYVEDPATPRFVKLNYLWTLASQYTNDENKYGYILDSLSSLHPIELVPDFSYAFKSTESVANQRKLIAAIFSALEQDDINALNSQMNNVILAQNFIREILLQNRNPEILRYVVQMYPSVTPTDQAEKDIAIFFKRTDIPGIQHLFSGKEKALLKLRMAFVTPQQQSRQLANLIAENKNDNTFKHALCFMLNSVPAQDIAQDIKTPAQRYLTAAKSTLAKSGDPDNSPCDWLNAYATVTVSDETQKDEFMLNYIRNENDGEVRANLLMNLSKPLFAKISAADRRYYQTELNKLLLSRQPATPEEKANIVNALGRVSSIK